MHTSSFHHIDIIAIDIIEDTAIKYIQHNYLINLIIFIYIHLLGAHVRAVSLSLSPASTAIFFCYCHLVKFLLLSAFSLYIMLQTKFDLTMIITEQSCYYYLLLLILR